MAKKVYLVTFDSHDDSWGCEICCGGIFRSKKRAEKVANCLPRQRVYVTEVIADNFQLLESRTAHDFITEKIPELALEEL